MFEKETVFILGAGASWHYGYPTGEDLVASVRKKAQDIERFITDLDFYETDYLWPKFVAEKHPIKESPLIADNRSYKLNSWQKVKDQCHRLNKALGYVKPVVIDNFLGQTPELKDIGKLLVSWVILECETQYYAPQTTLELNPDDVNAGRRDQAQYNINHIRLTENSPSRSTQSAAKNIDITKHKDDWCRFILHRLAQKPSELLNNKLTFVTFNYDVSLERSIYKGLTHIEKFEPKSIDRFFEKDIFLHIYGQIHKNFKDKQVTLESLVQIGDRRERIKYLRNLQKIWDKAYECSQTIFTVEDCEQDLGEKNNCEMISIQACKKIQEAEHVYILGYGFDERNSKRLELNQHLNDRSPPGKKVYFTNFGDRNVINKKASNIFLNSPDRFFHPVYINSPTSEHKTKRSYYEKSTKNVYEALEQDFDFLMIMEDS